MKVLASIDSLTIVGDCNNIPKFFSVMSNPFSPLAQFIESSWLTPSKINYHDNFKFLDGSFLQVSHQNMSVNVRDFRLDINLNKCDKQLLFGLLVYFHDLAFTRIDIALDYIGYDMSTMRMVSKPGRSWTMFGTPANGLETHYEGGRDSELQFRLYNKAVEQDLKDIEWIRLELQHRPSSKMAWDHAAFDYAPCPYLGDLTTKPWESILLYQLLKTSGIDDIKDRAMVEFLLNNPEQLGNLSRKIRSKYKKLMLAGVPQVQPTPLAVVTAALPQLQATIDELRDFCGTRRVTTVDVSREVNPLD